MPWEAILINILCLSSFGYPVTERSARILVNGEMMLELNMTNGRPNVPAFQADFACPGLLDSYSAFSKIYEKPILKSRAPGCSTKDQELGQARAEKVNRHVGGAVSVIHHFLITQLGEITREFVLRRTADILSNYLPPKRKCAPSRS
jgi:hypothetical protein